jgi:hypothetical protein
MPSRFTQNPTLHRLASFLFWTLLFALAYTQSPLYTSNQNQYFLRGLANAGLGTLSEDWLANIPDTVPVFNSLVEWTTRIFHGDVLFYVYYALLMGVYLFSLLGIASLIFDIQKTPRQRLFFLALLIFVHSAAIRFVITTVLDADWTYVLEDGFAGQRMLGPVFEPSVFAVFLVLAVYLFLRRQPILAALAAALAAIMHPTYLLPSGLVVFGFMVSLYLEDHQLKKPFLTGLVALAAVSPVLIYVAATFWGTTPALAAHAQSILVDVRIPHHADIQAWFGAPEAAKIVLIAAALWLVRKTRLFSLMLTISLATVVLILVQTVTRSDALALLFPWRPTILLVPLAMTVLLAVIVKWLLKPREGLRAQELFAKALPWLCAVLIAGSVIAGLVRFGYELERKNEIPEHALFDFVAAHRLPGQVYLIPLKMQDFRLATDTPAYVDFKAIPYIDVRVLDWYSRVLMASEFYQNPDCTSFSKFIAEARVTDIILENSQNDLNCNGAAKIYQDEHYKIFMIDASLLK